MLADPETAEVPPAPPSETAEVPPTPPSRLLAVAATTPPTARTDVVLATEVTGICVFTHDGVLDATLLAGIPILYHIHPLLFVIRPILTPPAGSRSLYHIHSLLFVICPCLSRLP